LLEQKLVDSVASFLVGGVDALSAPVRQTLKAIDLNLKPQRFSLEDCPVLRQNAAHSTNPENRSYRLPDAAHTSHSVYIPYQRFQHTSIQRLLTYDHAPTSTFAQVQCIIQTDFADNPLCIICLLRLFIFHLHYTKLR
jgi:hypothetical protein